jgi:hypothetical protein
MMGSLGVRLTQVNPCQDAGMIFKREPALILGFVQTVLALALAFGVDLTVEQTGEVLAVSAAFLAVVTRQVVTPAK